MKKTISIVSFFVSLLFSLVVSMFVAPALHVPILPVLAVLFALSFIPMKSLGFGFRAGITKEIWIDQILEGYFPDGSFMQRSRDFSALVQYNKINLAEAGVTPDVIVDNTSFPVPIVSRTDVPLELPLQTLDTENTVVRNIEEMESSYNKMASVIYGHRMALSTKATYLAAWNWAPQTNDSFSPVLAASATDYNAAGYKKLSFADILSLEAVFDNFNLPEAGRCILLNPTHKKDLMAEDMKLYKQILADKKVFSFDLYTAPVTPLYTALGVKQAFGSAKTSTSAIASIAWHENEVMRAQGSVDVFARYKDPENRGDLIGFQQRFIALQMRSKYTGAIYSTVKP